MYSVDRFKDLVHDGLLVGLDQISAVQAFTFSLLLANDLSLRQMYISVALNCRLNFYKRMRPTFKYFDDIKTQTKRFRVKFVR